MHSAFGTFQDLKHSAEPDASTFNAYQSLSEEMCNIFTNTSTKTFTPLRNKLGLKGIRRGGESQRLRVFRSTLCKYFAQQGVKVRLLSMPLINQGQQAR